MLLSFRQRIIVSTAAVLMVLIGVGTAHAEDPTPSKPTTVQVGKPVEKSKVPAVLTQGAFLPPQSVSAVDISGDGSRIAVTTMAFRHDRNVFVLSDEGKVLANRYVLPWAPFQVGATNDGGPVAIGLAYSRVTSPFPTTALLQDELKAETVQSENAREPAWLRYGSGDWRTGWMVSSLGDQVVRAGDDVYTISGDGGSWRVADAGGRKKSAVFSTQRPYRLAASGDGRILAFAHFVPDISRLENGTLPESFRAQAPRVLASLYQPGDGKEIGRIKPSTGLAGIAALPDPVADFPDLAKSFSLRPDAIVPFQAAASVAVNADGSRIAILEYSGWLWVRGRPAIGQWDPPYHIIPFVPKQRGWLRLTDGAGQEIGRTQLPKEGLFEVRLDDRGDRAWCYPASWFARGMAGSTWLPTDADARTVNVYDASRSNWSCALEFPDAIGDLDLSTRGERVLVSCWDGNIYLLDAEGKSKATLAVAGPARVRWSQDGRFAIAGTQGELFCLGADGKQRWRIKLPAAEAPALKEPIKRVFDDVPIYQVSRVGPEHAYVGDTWLIKTGRGGILIDAGGTSGIPLTLQRIESAGADIKDVRYLLHTHSHGDHCGAGYLWRAMGLKVVAPESADFTLAWLMPTLSDYSIWPPRPVDVPLALKRAGDEVEFTLSGLMIRAIFVPGHSFDSVIYVMELDGKRVAFTGDIGFDNQQEILHRCWGDVVKAKAVTDAVRTKLLPLNPDFVFRGHGAKRDGTAWLEDLVKRSDEAIRKAESGKK